MNELPNTGLFWLGMLSQQQMNCNYNCYNPYNQSFQSQTQCTQQMLEGLRDSVQANNNFSFQQEQMRNVINSIHPEYYDVEYDENVGNYSIEYNDELYPSQSYLSYNGQRYVKIIGTKQGEPPKAKESEQDQWFDDIAAYFQPIYAKIENNFELQLKQIEQFWAKMYDNRKRL